MTAPSTNNTIATPIEFAQAGLALLKNELVFTKKCSSQFDKEFTGKPKRGGLVKAKRMPEFNVRRGRVADVQDVLEGEVSIRLSEQMGVDYKFNSWEAATSLDSLLLDRALASAMAQLAQEVDTYAWETAYKGTYSVAGTAGQLINSATDFFEGPKRLAKMSVPATDRHSVLSVDDGYALAGFFTGGAAFQSDMSKAAVERARIPMIADVDAVWSQTISDHTNGTWAGGAQIKGANQNVQYSEVLTTYTQTLLIDDLSDGATIKKGDKFTIANVYAVNRRTKAKQSYLQQFTVVSVDATFSTSGSSEIEIEITPPIIAPPGAGLVDAYQTVDSVPADDAALTIIASGSGSWTPNLCFHRDAYALVHVDLERPHNGEYEIVRDPDTGISLRYWRYSDGKNDEHNHRFDLICGANVIDPRLATVQFGLS